VFIRILALCLFVSLSACQQDLIPSGEDTRAAGVPSVSPDFTVSLSDGSDFTLSSALTEHDAVVLYFSMWCPVCDEHMQHLRDSFVPAYPNVQFVLVDYVSNSISSTYKNQRSAGYMDFLTISDHNNYLQNLFAGTMGSTLVIDKNFVVQMAENFKAGEQLSTVLNSL
jgi:peroxiredoxin